MTNPQPQSNSQPERMGLVLSGGGLKFAVHAGLFKRLEELECNTATSSAPLIQAFDCVVGTSAGSLIASAIACGYHAQDVKLFSFLFAQKGFDKYILDFNLVGLGQAMLSMESHFLKGVFRGEAIQRTLEVFFSHNFLTELGNIYSRLASERKKAVEESELRELIFKEFRHLYNLPRETFDGAGGKMSKAATTGSKPTMLKLITFQDINSPDETTSAFADESEVTRTHRAAYIKAWQTYHEGWNNYYRANLPPAVDEKRPLLLIIGTDLVTGQNTIFANSQRFNQQISGNTLTTNSNANYYYINEQEKLGDLAQTTIPQELRPTNYIYKELPDGLPVAWAVRSSLSIPGIFVPNEIYYNQDVKGKLIERRDFFIDGGVTDNYALKAAADPNIGNCKHILGGNIGNLGRRVHGFKKTNLLDIVQGTLLMMGDANVDANATNVQLSPAKVLTINELTSADDVSITELGKIPNLYEEGYALATQVFTAIWGTLLGLSSGEVISRQQLLKIFDNDKSSYKIILPNIGMPPLNPSCEIIDAKGAGAVMKLIEAEAATKSLRESTPQLMTTATEQISIISDNNSELAGKLAGCEKNLDTKNLSQTWFPKSFGKLFIWMLVFVPILSFVVLPGLGLWRLILYPVNLVWEQSIGGKFDSLHYGDLFLMTVLSALLGIVSFLRLTFFLVTLRSSTRLLYSLLATAAGLLLYIVGLLGAAGQTEIWYDLLVVLSAQGLLFVFGLWLGQLLYDNLNSLIFANLTAKSERGK